MRLLAVMIVLVTMSFMHSCASKKSSLREHKGSYLESAKLNFDAGEQSLKDGDYEKAVTYFQFVRSKYPFSQYAALSDLKIADAKYLQEKWLEAASAYEVFIRLHPRHEMVSYASYRVGLSYFHAVPSDFFLYPPSTSREQSFTRHALSALERFIAQFPNSENISDAKDKRTLLFSYLAQHNQHIARYYVRRGRFAAAIDRYLDVENLYPETKESAESLFLAAELYRKELNEPERAMELYAQIVETKQSSPFAKKASQMLEKYSTSTPDGESENE